MFLPAQFLCGKQLPPGVRPEHITQGLPSAAQKRYSITLLRKILSYLPSWLYESPVLTGELCILLRGAWSQWVPHALVVQYPKALFSEGSTKEVPTQRGKERNAKLNSPGPVSKASPGPERLFP